MPRKAPASHDAQRPSFGSNSSRVLRFAVCAMVVDVWAQPASNLDFLPEVEPLFRKSQSPIFEWMKAGLHLSPERLLKLMDEGGVDQVLLSAWTRPHHQPLISNETVAQLAQANPDRVFGLAAVNLLKPMKAIDELKHCVSELGFRGLRVVNWLWEKPPTHALYYPLLATCVQLGVPFCTQVGHTGPMMVSETGRPIPYIDQIALDFPDLKIVCGHIGYPWTEEMIAVATKHRNVYIDTSAYLPTTYPTQIVQYINTHGKAKVMFGTNWPQLSWRRCVDALSDLPLKPEAKRMFVDDNARRVFGLPTINTVSNGTTDSRL